MTYDAVVGCQYGSEAKGLVCVELAKINKYDACVSVNSCQSGHTHYDTKGTKIVNRQLPSSFAHCDRVFIGAGALIKPHVLKEEIEYLRTKGYNLDGKLFIDESATVIPDNASEFEKELVSEIASTGEGVGYAMQQRVMRKAKTVGDMKEFFGQFGVVGPIWKRINMCNNVLLEGTQGFGLSLIHGEYPHVTSRDTTIGTLSAGACLNIKKLNKVYGVVRTFPIRVGTVVKTSGPMFRETSWDEVRRISGYEHDISEKTTVTGRIRRVSFYDQKQVEKAIVLNGVDELVVTFVNYLGKENEYVSSIENLNEQARNFLSDLDAAVSFYNCKVGYFSGNPHKIYKK